MCDWSDEIIERKTRFSPFLKQCFVTAAVSTNVIGFGCTFGFPGILIPQLLQPDSPISITNQQASWLASVESIAMIFGNFMIPAVMARAGRKAAHYTVIFFSLLGWLTFILATVYEVLLLGRILQGFSVGMFMPLRSVLIGEYSSPRHRGGFITTTSLAQTLGILIVHLAGSLVSYQIAALGSTSFTIISLLLTIFSPESPSWLATRGQFEKCRENFLWLRGEEELPEVDKMIQTIKKLEEDQTQDQNKLNAMLAVAKKKEFYKPIFLMFALYIMLSYAGGVLMGAYSVSILSMAMGADINAHFWMVIIDCQRLLFCCVAVYVINKVRRRTMLFSIGALCAGSRLFIAAYVFAKTKGYLPFDSMWIPVLLISLQTLSISMGMQPLPAVIAGEVFPLQHRSLAGSIGLVASCGSIFVVLKAFPGLTSSVGIHGAYALYSGTIVACLMVAWFLLPETSGKTLQEIEEHFRGQPVVDLETNCKESESLKM